MRHKITVSVSEPLYATLSARAAEEGVSLASWCYAAVERATRLKRLPVEPRPIGLAAADHATRQAVTSAGGRAGGRGRKKD